MTYSDFKDRKDELDLRFEIQERNNFDAEDYLISITKEYQELVDNLLEALEPTKLSDKQLFSKMKRLIEAADKQSKISNQDCYEKIWDEFWKLHKQVSVDIDWCDPDTTYEEDILACFNAYKEMEFMFEALD